jgi:antitoxin MazE
MSNNVITTQSLQKWGNSAGIRLPKRVIEKARLELDQDLTVSVQGRSVILTPVDNKKHLALEDMLRGVTPENVGGEYDWGSPAGKEIW